MEVRFSYATRLYLAELIKVLYERDYFGFEEAAKQYVEDLVDDIVQNIQHKHKKIAPDYFSRYGKNMYYTAYRKNKNTTWYVFFNYTEELIYIRYIGNNHSIGQHL